MGYGHGRGRGRGWGKGSWGKQRGWEIFLQQPQLPLHTYGVRVAAPVSDRNGVSSIISQVFARSQYIAIVDIKGSEIVSVNIHSNPAAAAPQGAGLVLAQWLISNNVRVVLTPNIGANLAQALAQAGIYAYQVPSNIRLIDALRSIGLVK